MSTVAASDGAIALDRRARPRRSMGRPGLFSLIVVLMCLLSGSGLASAHGASDAAAVALSAASGAAPSGYTLLAEAAPPSATHGPDAQSIHVVYHLSEGLDQASRALGNIRNHLIGDPTVHIVVVAHGPGIDFLLDGARDARGNPYDIAIQELAQKGVEFRACNNTLKARNIDRSRLVPEATVVPAGVVEVTRLQAREGYAYIHP